MNLLSAIKREQRKLEKRLGKLQSQLDGVKAAAKALGRSAGNELDGAGKRRGSQSKNFQGRQAPLGKSACRSEKTIS